MLISEIIAFVILSSISIWGMISEMQSKTKKKWKIILWGLLGICAFGFGLYALLSKPEMERAFTQEIIDSSAINTKNIREDINKEFESTKNNIIDTINQLEKDIVSQTKDGFDNLNIPKTREEEVPFLDVLNFSSQPNPYISKHPKGFTFYAILGSADKKIITNIQQSYVIVNYTQNIIRITSSHLKGYANETTSVYGNTASKLILDINIDSFESVRDTFYLYLKSMYSNKNHIPQIPNRKIYRITKEDLDGRQLLEANNVVYEFVKSHIQSKKMW